MAEAQPPDPLDPNSPAPTAPTAPAAKPEAWSKSSQPMPGDKTYGAQVNEDKNPLFIVAYFFTIFSGAILFVIAKENKRLQFHAMQSIYLGIISFIVGILIGILAGSSLSSFIVAVLWIYGVYLGFKAYDGEDLHIPFIGEYSHQKVNGSNQPQTPPGNPPQAPPS